MANVFTLLSIRDVQAGRLPACASLTAEGQETRTENP
jgi:hypothetical protein